MMHPAPADFRTTDSLARRDRIYAAMLDLVTSKGYDAIGVEELFEHAEISRGEFEREFSSIEDCALAVFQRFMEDCLGQVREAYESVSEWPDSLRAAAYQLASWLDQHPRETRFGALEFLWVSEMARARREATFQRFVDFVDAGRQRLDDPDSVPRSEAEGVVGSIAEMLTKGARNGELGDAKRYVPQLMYFAVLPYLGPEAAAEELETPPPAEP